jgi:hypothetical protein
LCGAVEDAFNQVFEAEEGEEDGLLMAQEDEFDVSHQDGIDLDDPYLIDLLADEPSTPLVPVNVSAPKATVKLTAQKRKRDDFESMNFDLN